MEGLTLRLVDGVYDDQGVGALLDRDCSVVPWKEPQPVRSARAHARRRDNGFVRNTAPLAPCARAQRSYRVLSDVAIGTLDYRRAPPGGVFDRTFLALGRTPKVKRESGGADSGKQSHGGAFSSRAAVQPPLS